MDRSRLTDDDALQTVDISVTTTNSTATTSARATATGATSASNGGASTARAAASIATFDGVELPGGAGAGAGAGSTAAASGAGICNDRRLPWALCLALLVVAVVAISLALVVTKPAISTPEPPSKLENAHVLYVIGDWGREGNPPQTAVAESMGVTAAHLPPQAIISTGDNMYTYGVKSVDDPLFDRSWKDVYTAPTIQVPWYITPGNHDWRGNIWAEVNYTKKGTNWIMPYRYYEKTLVLDDVKPTTACAKLIMLDTSPFNPELPWKDYVLSQSNPPQQLAWFRDRLAANTCQWLFGFAHHPLYSAGGHGDNEVLIEKLLPLFQQYKMDAWIAGHDHDVQHTFREGMNFYVSGGGSNIRDDLNMGLEGLKFAKAANAFLTMSLNTTTARFDFVGTDGNSMYTAYQSVQTSK